MEDGRKTEEQLTKELETLRQQLAKTGSQEQYESAQYYLTLLHNVSDVIYSLSPDGIITSLNPAFEKATGLSCADWIGKSFAKIIHPDDLPFALEKFLSALRGESSPKFELRTISSSGNYLTGEFTTTPLMQDGKVVKILGIVRDITEHKQMAEKLKSLSLYDDLTGLYNRRGFLPLAEKSLSLANRQKKDLLMIYLDLNDLKVINDTWGHLEGDQALMDTAEILKKTYRVVDIIARMSGDEFAVMLVGAAKNDIGTVTGRLQNNIEAHNAANIRNYTLSICCGVSYYDTENPCSLDEFISRADHMMYEQKRLRRKS
jgi:diguanylate cyclase (GGDEF)-like protein/PAS domain S-box-containing protein